MEILITGGFGFVGGRLAKYFSKAGHKITLGSRNFANPPEWLPQASVAKLEWNDYSSLERVCDGVDFVIHAAGMNTQDCDSDPVAALAFNGLATARLVAAASRVSVKKFIYLSTAHVYASPLKGTLTEDACPRNLHPYATSHLSGEYSVLRASQLGQIQGAVMRLSNAFGAPMHKAANCWMLLVNDLCRQAVETRMLLLQTSGLQQRDFISLANVCQVADNLLLNQSWSDASGVFNVGSGSAQSVLKMAQLIQQRCIQVLGFEPVLKRAEGKMHEQHPSLAYVSARMPNNGSNINEINNTMEIDELLQFCKISFSNNFST